MNRREKIIEQAINQLDKGGMASFSARKVADLMGIPPSGVFYHFPTHQELFNGVQVSIMEKADSIVQSYVKQINPEQEGLGLEAYFRGTLHWAFTYPAHVKILAMGFLYGEGGPSLAEQSEFTTSRGLKKIYTFLAIGVAEKKFSADIELQMESRIIHAFLTGASQQILYSPFTSSLEFEEFVEKSWAATYGRIKNSSFKS